MNSFERAISQNYIPAVDSQLKDNLRKSLDARRINDVLRPAKEGEPASLGDLFDTLGADWLKQDVRQKTARLLQDVAVESDDFLPRLKEIIPDENQRQDVRRTRLPARAGFGQQHHAVRKGGQLG